MLYSVLNAAGVRAGLFTSPYLVKFNERMSALGHDISDSELASVVEGGNAPPQTQWRIGRRNSSS